MPLEVTWCSAASGADQGAVQRTTVGPIVRIDGRHVVPHLELAKPQLHSRDDTMAGCNATGTGTIRGACRSKRDHLNAGNLYDISLPEWKTLEMCSNPVFHVNHSSCSFQHDTIVCHVLSQTAVRLQQSDDEIKYTQQGKEIKAGCCSESYVQYLTSQRPALTVKPTAC